MRTIITYKATDLAPELKDEFVDLFPSFDLAQDTVDLLDYDCNVVVADIDLKKIKEIKWDENEHPKEEVLTLPQIVDDYIQLRMRAGVPVAILRASMTSHVEAIGSTFEEVQLLAITRATTINDEE